MDTSCSNLPAVRIMFCATYHPEWGLVNSASSLVRKDPVRARPQSLLLVFMTQLKEPFLSTDKISGRCVWRISSEQWQSCSRTTLTFHSPENIGLGDPTRMHDNAAIERAARLRGSSELIAKLPEGFDTYLERPVRDLSSGLADETSRLQRFVDTSTDHGLSGGQMQRLAVARTFMRSSSTEQGVGLLLFDEPSASLDPTAEHDLFSRLRELRGNKTMIFSTHRFGNLTRHADLILYMNDSRIIETGTHEGLLKSEGSDYGRLWRMQADAFLRQTDSYILDY